MQIPWWAAWLLNFVAVDYVYYWNHRLLHSQALWRWHAVHHSASAMDVLVTARNTLWTPALIVYLWVNGVVAFVLADATPYLVAAAATAALDLWRHTAWAPSDTPIWRLLAAVFIMPRDHAWHHSTDRPGCNFGANLRYWDVIHGTAWRVGTVPATLGIAARGTLAARLLWPPRP